jgi:hypothetical protein
MVNATPPGKEKHYPLYGRLGGPGQVQSNSPLLRFDPQTIQLVASSYTGYVIVAKLLSLVKLNSKIEDSFSFSAKSYYGL